MLVLLLAACDKGKKAPSPPTPMGIIKGRVTATINGPDRAHAPSENFSHMTGIECTILVIDTLGKTFETKSHIDAAPADGTRATDGGRYEVSVPVGHYEISFNDCRGDRSCEVPTPKPVDVVVGSAATVDWDCEMDAK